MRTRLQACDVVSGQAKHYGFLLFQNDRVVVLVNDVRDKADLGPLKKFRERHCEPEANVKVFPRDQVDAVLTMRPLIKRAKK